MLRRTLVVLLLLAACVAPRAQAINVDGYISDWGVELHTYYWHSGWQSGRAFVQSSFIPDPLGTIDYKVQDYWPSDDKPRGGELNDYEAAYFDDSETLIYVGIISSHPWKASEDVFRVTANGITINFQQFDEHAWHSLGIDEIMNGHHYPNYFYEGAILASRFGSLSLNDVVTVYANCNSYKPPPDSITLCGTVDNLIPEPATLSLMGLALTALAGRQWRRRRAA